MSPNAVVDGRLSFQEIMSLASLPDQIENGKIVKRYMSQRRAWCPGESIPVTGPVNQNLRRREAGYGGHVYSQAGIAASRAFGETQATRTDLSSSLKKHGIHTIHGYFSEAGIPDRPFIYNVLTIAANPSFHNMLVTAQQPLSSSTNEAGDHFPIADAQLPLGPVCFTALVSFRPSIASQFVAQETSVQARFADILSSRPPSAWKPSPDVDIDKYVAEFPVQGVSTFPAMDVRKVDLSAFNKGKPLHERRELLMYRLIAPLPADNPDVHFFAHAYQADRNGLLMLGNNAGFGYNFGRAASLSYSFVLHVNPEDMLMAYGEDEWWIEEACFPRVEAGRGVIQAKIWSPKGVHVATEYQDGIVQRQWKHGERREKL